MMLTQKRLKEVLDYNPETGVFRWKERISVKTTVGVIAGGINADGYLQIGIENTRYYSHRLAFLWMTGNFPEKQIDHKNGKRDDIRWDNLREGSNQENSFNCANRRSSRRSKYKGLWFWKKRNEWQVKIKCGEIIKTIGYFSSEEEAAREYDNAAIKYHGEFARLNFPESAIT